MPVFVGLLNKLVLAKREIPPPPPFPASSRRPTRGPQTVRLGDEAALVLVRSNLELLPFAFSLPWGLIRKTVPPFCRIRVSAKMGGLPSSTGQPPSAADGSRIDAAPTAREKSSHLTGCPPGIMGEEGK